MHNPILFCLDDVHWADPESMFVVRHLLTEQAGGQVDRKAPRADVAPTTALRESAAAASRWLAAVPTATLAAALRVLAEKHPCDAVYAESAAKLEQFAEGQR